MSEETVETKNEVVVQTETVVPTKTVESHDDIFITENDTFTLEVQYYKANGDIKVKKVDDDFDEKAENIKTISFTCKYPSQGDYQTMVNSGVYKSINENISGLDMIQLEMIRLSLLLRTWTIKKPIEEMINMDPKIVKAMLLLVNERIGLKGIF